MSHRGVSTASSAAMLSNTVFISDLSFQLVLDPLVGPNSKESSCSIIAPRHFRFYMYTLFINNVLIIMITTQLLTESTCVVQYIVD